MPGLSASGAQMLAPTASGDQWLKEEDTGTAAGGGASADASSAGGSLGASLGTLDAASGRGSSYDEDVSALIDRGFSPTISFSAVRLAGEGGVERAAEIAQLVTDAAANAAAPPPPEGESNDGGAALASDGSDGEAVAGGGGGGDGAQDGGDGLDAEGGGKKEKGLGTLKGLSAGGKKLLSVANKLTTGGIVGTVLLSSFPPRRRLGHGAEEAAAPCVNLRCGGSQGPGTGGGR